MDAERIKEIQSQTPYPDSQSVAQALMQVWNEAGQEAEQTIAKLRAEVKAIEQTWCEEHGGSGHRERCSPCLARQIADLKAENEKLKEFVEEMGFEQTISDLKAENERLEEGRAFLAKQVKQWEKIGVTNCAEIADLRERLREVAIVDDEEVLEVQHLRCCRVCNKVWVYDHAESHTDNCPCRKN